VLNDDEIEWGTLFNALYISSLQDFPVNKVSLWLMYTY
jgi:hypothetical protein